MFWGSQNDSRHSLKNTFLKKAVWFFITLADPPPPGLAKDHKKYGFFRHPSLTINQEINCFQTLTTSKSNIICMTTYHWNCQGLSKLVWVWWDIQYMVEIYRAYSSLHVPDQLNNMTHLSFSSKDRRFNKKNTFAFLLLLKCIQNGTPQKANSHDIWAESAAMPCKSWTLVVQSLS